MSYRKCTVSVWLLDDNTCLNNFNYRPVALAIRAGFLVCDLAKVLDLNYEQSVEVFENVWNAASAGTWSPGGFFPSPVLTRWDQEELGRLVCP